MSQLSPTKRTWARGLTVFAATIMIVAGVFQALQGLVALANSEFYVVGSEYTFEFDITAWGWIHLVLGVLQCAVAFFLLRGAMWARITAVALVALNALEQLAFLGANPFWATIIIVLDVVVIWAIVVHGDEARSF